MKVCFVSKYPPIEGYVSSYTYWLVQALGERGHTVHVITNALEVDPQYREDLDVKSKAFIPKGVILHSTVPDNRLGSIPINNPFTEKLASICLDILDTGISLIDSWYLIPYGVAALLASLLSGLPLVGRFAGTDIERMCRSEQFQTLASYYFEHCRRILGAHHPLSQVFPQYCSKAVSPGVVLNTDYFNPRTPPVDLTFFPQYSEGIPIITYVGKALSQKGFYRVVYALSRISEPFLLLVVSNGGEYTQFRECVKRYCMEERTLFMNFQPPWKMPSIYTASTAVLSLEHGGLIGRAPYIPREASSCGCCTIMSPEIHSKWYYRMMEHEVDTVVADPENTEELREALQKVIKNPEKAQFMGMNAHTFFLRLDNKKNHDNYIERTLSLYKEVTT